MRKKPLPCICKGNWRLIVHEVEDLIGKIFVDQRCRKYRFLGVLHAEDDYCYVMSGKSGLYLLSCVGSIEGNGFKLAKDQRPPAARTRSKKLLREIFGE